MVDKELVKKDKRFYESTPKKIINQLEVWFLIAISHLPFWFIYRLSDFFYLLLRYVIKYRKSIIFQNLTNAFPEKTEEEIKEIAGKFYRHFCDMSLETVKLYSMGEKQIDKRIQFNYPKITDDYYNQGKSFILFGMHYNNWEWSSAGQRKGKHRLLMIYNPIRGNQAFEKYILHLRGKWGGKLIPVHKSARLAIEFARMETPTAIWLGADQTPPANSQFWTIFLNQEAPFFTGPEKIAHRSNQPVFFHHTRKIKRGRYEVDFIPLFEHPGEMESKDILLGYIRKMEEIIRETPEYYLWSHRRWKHKRPEGIELTL
jgi:KDO2-lipid IV(A) lauroyltransferase